MQYADLNTETIEGLTCCALAYSRLCDRYWHAGGTRWKSAAFWGQEHEAARRRLLRLLAELDKRDHSLFDIPELDAVVDRERPEAA